MKNKIANFKVIDSKNNVVIDKYSIKYNCTWIPDRPLISSEIAELNYWRNRLYQLGFGQTAFSSLRNRFGLNTQNFDEYYSKCNT